MTKDLAPRAGAHKMAQHVAFQTSFWVAARMRTPPPELVSCFHFMMPYFLPPQGVTVKLKGFISHVVAQERYQLYFSDTHHRYSLSQRGEMRRTLFCHTG
jgi:hypothetical protein